MELVNNNNLKLNYQSYNYDQYSNIIAENIDDLLYDKFYYNIEPIKKSVKTNDKPKYPNKINPKKVKNKNYKIKYNLFIYNSIDIKKYKDFINKNKKIFLSLQNKHKKKRNISHNKKKEIINKNNSAIITDKFNKIKNKIHENMSSIEEYKERKEKINKLLKLETSKQKNIDSDNFAKNKNKLTNLSNYNLDNSKNKNDLLKGKLNDKNLSQINNEKFYNNLEKLYNLKKCNYNFLNKFPIHANNYKSKENFKDNYFSSSNKNIFNFLSNKNKNNVQKIKYDNYPNINFIKKRNKNKKFTNLTSNEKKKEDEKIIDDNFDENFVSFSYPKNLNNTTLCQHKDHHYYYRKHFGNQFDCPLCQTNSEKTILNKRKMGIIFNNKSKPKKENIREKVFRKNFGKNIHSNKNSNSKIIQYRKNLCFYNATKGIQESNSVKEIKSLNNSKTNKNSFSYNYVINNSPIMIYYFK